MLEERAHKLVKHGYILMESTDALDIIHLAEVVQIMYGISKDEIKIETFNNQIKIKL
jgi:hypothetical protein